MWRILGRFAFRMRRHEKQNKRLSTICASSQKVISTMIGKLFGKEGCGFTPSQLALIRSPDSVVGAKRFQNPVSYRVQSRPNEDPQNYTNIPKYVCVGNDCFYHRHPL